MSEEKADQPPQRMDGQRQEPEAPEQTVHLPSYISDEFGTPRSEVRMHVALGKVEIDGEEFDGDKFDVPRSKLAGKTVRVVSEQRTYTFTVPE